VSLPPKRQDYLALKCPGCGLEVREFKRVNRFDHQAPVCEYFKELLRKAPRTELTIDSYQSAKNKT
jgi:hypothetical protein